ncbi:uncharacterized protein LOC142320279 [Lycorma delicatula]|uniref:uncharacterized protein LOC142320279 n=1 Tax=Lycorma delicatula TaxID=130591 RepID=UPI003F51AACF
MISLMKPGVFLFSVAFLFLVCFTKTNAYFSHSNKEDGDFFRIRRNLYIPSRQPQQPQVKKVPVPQSNHFKTENIENIGNQADIKRIGSLGSFIYIGSRRNGNRNQNRRNNSYIGNSKNMLNRSKIDYVENIGGNVFQRMREIDGGAEKTMEAGKIANIGNSSKIYRMGNIGGNSFRA